MKIRIISSIVIGSSLACAVAWLAGYDLDARGIKAVMTVFLAVVLSAYAAACPVWESRQ